MTTLRTVSRCETTTLFWNLAFNLSYGLQNDSNTFCMCEKPPTAFWTAILSIFDSDCYFHFQSSREREKQISLLTPNSRDIELNELSTLATKKIIERPQFNECYVFFFLRSVYSWIIFIRCIWEEIKIFLIIEQSNDFNKIKKNSLFIQQCSNVVVFFFSFTDYYLIAFSFFYSLANRLLGKFMSQFKQNIFEFNVNHVHDDRFIWITWLEIILQFFFFFVCWFRWLISCVRMQLSVSQSEISFVKRHPCVLQGKKNLHPVFLEKISFDYFSNEFVQCCVWFFEKIHSILH